MADLQKKSTDLSTLLPKRFRDKTITTLMRNLFNKQLTKKESQTIFGYIGSQAGASASDVYVVESTAERQINQLIPIIYSKYATVENIWTWQDLLQKLVIAGVDYDTISDWCSSLSYNFAPPIDLDKFCNFNEYMWIGPWVMANPGLPYDQLGIPITQVQAALARSNPNAIAEYYVIGRGALDNSGNPLAPIPTLTTWSDWSLCNLWVHTEDVIGFYNSFVSILNLSDISTATRPIIEYFNTLKLNTFVSSTGAPADSGAPSGLAKTRTNQPPLFDLYYHDGTHTGLASSTFYYVESSTAPIDGAIGRRLEIDSIDEFTFSHSFQASNGEMLYTKSYDGSKFNLGTIWSPGADVSTSYVKYDTTGTMLNADKFNNYQNYYWTGATTSIENRPAYNITGNPEYYVIGTTGTSDWAVYNFWVHVSALKQSDLKLYIQATKPIIELNPLFEASLVEQKTAFNQIPIIKKYTYDQNVPGYVGLPDANYPLVTDTYGGGVVLARTADLGLLGKLIENTSEIQNQCFTIGQDVYFQGLLSGTYSLTVDGQSIGYEQPNPMFSGTGNGSVSVSGMNVNTLVPQVVTLTATSATTFDVSSTTLAQAPSLTVTTDPSHPQTYTGISGLTFSVVNGTAPFAVGDTFVFPLKSTLYTSSNLYALQDTIYKTCTIATDIITEVASQTLVPADVTQKNGTWEIPDQFLWNVINETGTVISQGDLYNHFTTIIAAQPGFVGSEAGANNWRDLTNKNYGLGGTIKQFDGRFSLLAGMLMQPDVTVGSLIDFAQLSYEELLANIVSYCENVLPAMISTGQVVVPSSGDSIDPSIISSFNAYYSESEVVAQSSTTLDDHIAQTFYDTTSGFQNAVITLPYLGLVNKVLPQKTFNGSLNMPVLIHHDGHQTQLQSTNVDLLKRIVQKTFLRSNGQQTAGIIGGLSYPTYPFAGQYWFDTTTNTLYFYDVISDLGELPDTAPYGAYSYDRQANELWQFNGSVWTNVGSQEIILADPWTAVPMDLIIANMTLAIETTLYENCPPRNLIIDTMTLQAKPDYAAFMQAAFEQFGVKYNVTDVYASNFDQNNAFSWNYTNAVITGVPAGTSAWQDIYIALYGTSRPDWNPWLLCGYGDEASFMAALYANNIVPTGAPFSPALWPYFATFVLDIRASSNQSVEISVDPATGKLLAPYGTTIYNVLSYVPPGIANRYQFGQDGPIEMVWRTTTDYLYAQAKSYFKLDPMGFLESAWGDAEVTVGGYKIDQYQGKKLGPSDIMLHGATLPEVSGSDWVTFNVVTMPDYPLTYTVTIASRVDGLAMITGTILPEPVYANINTGYVDEYVNITFTPGKQGFSWGDVYNCTIDALSNLTTSYTPVTTYYSEGLNQLFVQYLRSYSSDLEINENYVFLTDWVIKLGYRFGALINSDVLSIQANDETVDSKYYSVFLKENQFTSSNWLNALRVQLVQRGTAVNSAGNQVPAKVGNGQPGDDWVYRIDTYNPNRTDLTWYTYDLTQTPSVFEAQNGNVTTNLWDRYMVTNGTMTFKAPFLITGLQNLINFLFGYADYLASQGWIFNDPSDPALDASGKPLGWQTAIESFISSQYLGVTAGTAYVLNPFTTKVWFNAPTGVVMALDDRLGLETETIPAILDSNAQQIPTSKMRVFRDEALTEIVFDTPPYVIHLLTSEYENVVVLEQYAADDVLLYDPFLGQQIQRLFVSGERQLNFNGRLSYGGQYLTNSLMRENMEAAVEKVLTLYDTTQMVTGAPVTEHARALLGYQAPSYFATRGSSDKTAFRFWQGMLSNKGTNLSIDAFINASSYKTYEIDEYWAYKIASYGDANEVIKTEIKVEPSDYGTDETSYLLIEADEVAGYTAYQDGQSASIYAPSTSQWLSSSYDGAGSIAITPTDEARWFSYTDIGTLSYFTTSLIAETTITVNDLNAIYVITNPDGSEVRADCYELVDSSGNVYYELGELIPSS